MAEFTLNISTCSKTGYSPFYLTNTREPVLPVSLLASMKQYVLIEKMPTMEHFVSQMKEIYEYLHEM
ncbi:Hypothetical protein SRAE_0000053900 [Strongyloides ratti]|uniref:Uncharacterized protein n=1 Tax=Strongyloides ratti TaxID=34506 RepID=A0A090KV69_STRRB|nr:Hypothetical protein SRAE_0000053900 [Strongyloides ratti]CEF61415.1 Hypothetical protein SRAE_0000053900 [Strongyloides ratti]